MAGGGVVFDVVVRRVGGGFLHLAAVVLLEVDFVANSDEPVTC